MDGMIFRKGEDVTPEVRVQNPIVEALAQLCIHTGVPSAKYLWLKFNSSDTLAGLVISDDETEYPDGVGADGYTYMRVYHVLGKDTNGDTFIVEL